VSSTKGEILIVPLLLGMKVDTEAAIIAYYIRDGEKNILVDTGYSIDPLLLKYFEPHISSYFERSEKQELPRALEQIKVQPEGIDIVINTHLHFDHCTNNHLFRNADWIVQRKELQYAIAPLPINQLKIPASETPEWRSSFGLIPMLQERIPINFTLVDGEKEITDNISVMLTPGHTPGSQSVIVRTDKGTIVISGDNVPRFEIWEQYSRNKKIPAAKLIYTAPYSKEEYLKQLHESFRKIRELEPLSVLPSHDPKVFKKEKYP